MWNFFALMENLKRRKRKNITNTETTLERTIRCGMTYTPSKDDPVLVFRRGGFGFNPLNPKMREGFWANVEKCSLAFKKR